MACAAFYLPRKERAAQGCVLGKSLPIKDICKFSRRKSRRKAQGKARPPASGRVTVGAIAPGPHATDAHYTRSLALAGTSRNWLGQQTARFSRFLPKWHSIAQNPADHSSNTSGKEARATSSLITSNAS